jgi:hypothetical protein
MRYLILPLLLLVTVLAGCSTSREHILEQSGPHHLQTPTARYTAPARIASRGDVTEAPPR